MRANPSRESNQGVEKTESEERKGGKQKRENQGEAERREDK
jgi:hypothetical protein